MLIYSPILPVFKRDHIDLYSVATILINISGMLQIIVSKIRDGNNSKNSGSQQDYLVS